MAKIAQCIFVCVIYSCTCYHLYIMFLILFPIGNECLVLCNNTRFFSFYFIVCKMSRKGREMSFGASMKKIECFFGRERVLYRASMRYNLFNLFVPSTTKQRPRKVFSRRFHYNSPSLSHLIFDFIKRINQM